MCPPASLCCQQIRPGDSWLRAFVTACPGRCLRGSVPPASFPALLAALASLRLRPDAGWLREVFAASMPSLDAMSAAELSATAAAASRLGFTPPEPWTASLAASSMWKLGAASPGQLASLAEGLVRLRAYPGSAWLTQYGAGMWCFGGGGSGLEWRVKGAWGCVWLVGIQ